MNDEQFEGYINKALESLPQEFRQKLENVSIDFADWPAPRQTRNLARMGQRGLIFGLYEGIPQTKRGRYGVGPTLPDKITIFKIPILMISKTFQDVERNIKNTVIHEIAHHFGLSEGDIRDANKAH